MYLVVSEMREVRGRAGRVEGLGGDCRPARPLYKAKVGGQALQHQFRSFGSATGSVVRARETCTYGRMN